MPGKKKRTREDKQVPPAKKRKLADASQDSPSQSAALSYTFNVNIIALYCHRQGSSSSMEKNGVLALFSHSKESIATTFQFKELISDGDSRAHMHRAT